MDSQTSRFADEGYQEPFTGWVKSITRKPVVGVGRFTSPDTMVGQIRRGVLDFIGAARPSIADPFLPRKIEEGRVEDIRECIGCNICVTGDMTSTPIRCTQNPTMGEEWRKGWHPERIAPSKSSKRVLVVGAGPAGLEAARALGQRGYEVHLAEASRELGGRVSLEARLPGLAQWARVRDWRVTQLQKMANVAIYRENDIGAADVLEFGAERVVLATGCHWRRDGYGRSNGAAIPGFDSARVFTPDDLMRGRIPDGPVLLFDDDAFYIGSVMAEVLRAAGREVVYVTPGRCGRFVDNLHAGIPARAEAPAFAGNADRHRAQHSRGRQQRCAARRAYTAAASSTWRARPSLPLPPDCRTTAWRTALLEALAAGLAGRGDRSSHADRRLPRPRADRARGVCRPPLRPRAGRAGRR